MPMWFLGSLPKSSKNRAPVVVKITDDSISLLATIRTSSERQRFDGVGRQLDDAFRKVVELLFHLSAGSLNLFIMRFIPATRWLDDDAHTFISACVTHMIQQVFRHLGLVKLLRRRHGFDVIDAKTAGNYRDNQRDGD